MKLFLPYNCCSRSIGTAHFPFIQIETSQPNGKQTHTHTNDLSNLKNIIFRIQFKHMNKHITITKDKSVTL